MAELDISQRLQHVKFLRHKVEVQRETQFFCHAAGTQTKIRYGF